MSRQLYALILFPLILSLTYSNETLNAPNYTMSLVMLYSDDVTDYDWVVTLNNSIAFRSIDGLKVFLQKQPNGTTIEWAPGCVRLGDEPLLNSEQELQEFRLFCRKHGFKLTIRSSG